MHMQAQIVSIRDIAAGIFQLRFSAPEMVAQGISPGQFVHIQVPGATQHLLRRPISIMHAWPDTGEIDLVIQQTGDGTRCLHNLRMGDRLSVLGPLGRGFMVNSEQRVFFVGGGVGVAPIRFALDHFASGRNPSAFFGFRSAAHAYGLEHVVGDLHVVTDDGSMGEHALVTDVVQDAIEQEKPDLILACGPAPMLRTLQHMAIRQSIPCQLSLEEYMACGMGACLVCSCKLRIKSGTEYRRVCIDGPVFQAKEVCFDG